MRILQANISNFYTFEDLPQVIFDETFNVVVGPNGAGKTALVLDALTWCLWGETPRGKGPKQADVSFTLEQRAEVFIVERRKGGDARLAGPSIRKHGVDGKGNAYEQFINGQTPTETQQKIEAIFGTYERFCAERVFSRRLQAKFGSETDKGRKALIESILGMEQYERAAKLARKDLTAKQAELSLRREEMARLQGSVEASESYLTARDADQEQALEELVARGERATTALAEARALLKEITRERESSYVRSNAVMRSLDDVRTHASHETREVSRAKDRLEALEREHAAILLKEECPLCLTPKASIEQRRLDDHYELLRAPHEAVILKAEVRVKVFEAEAKDLMADRDRLQAEFQQKDAALLEASGRESRAEREASEVERLLEARQKDQDRIEEARGQLKEKQEQLALRQGDVSNLELEIGEIAAAVEVLGSKGARVLQMEDALARVTREANRVLEALPPTEGAKPLSVELRTWREGSRGDVDEISIKVHGAGGGEYKGLSDGQQARVDIALMLGLARAGQSTGYLVFDEVFDSLDEAGVEAAAALVEELSHERQVVLVSHHPRFLDRLPAGRSAWKVSMKNGVSELTT